MIRGVALGAITIALASTTVACGGSSGSTSSVCSALAKDGHAATESLAPDIQSGQLGQNDVAALTTLANILSSDGSKASDANLKATTLALSMNYRTIVTDINSKQTTSLETVASSLEANAQKLNGFCPGLAGGTVPSS